MTSLVLPLLLMFAAVPAIAEAPSSDRAAFVQLSIRQRIVMRIPRILGGRRDPRVPPEETRWTEKKGPKCVPMLAIVGAIITDTDSVDLMVADGTRLRAKFDDKCPALDYYAGLYIKGTSDGLVCADRDSIRARSGSSCQIDKFRRLSVKRK